MKYILLTILLSCGHSYGQDELNFGFSSPYGMHYGLRAGADFGLSSLNKTKEKGEKELSISYWMNPEVMVHSRSRFYTDLSLMGNFVRERRKVGSKNSHRIGAGLGYMANLELISYTVNFQGEITSRDRDFRSYAMITASYEFQHEVSEKWSWYLRGTLGERVGLGRPNGAIAYVDLGVRINLKQEENE